MAPPRKPLYLTVDLEEWFHLLDCEAAGGPQAWPSQPSRITGNTHGLLDLFDRHQAKATFFVLGWVAEHHPALVREVQDRGHRIGCHSHHHTLVWSQSPEGFRSETRRAIQTIEEVTGTAIRQYRAPGFSITRETLWAFDVLMELGIEVDASLFPGRHAHGGLGRAFPDTPFWLCTPSGQVLEFPMSLTRWGPLEFATAGGGYFRALPWALIRHFILESTYCMTYFHPRDFDPDQPRLRPLSPGRHLKAYVGLGSAFSKLDRLLALTQGIPILQEEAHLAAPRVRLPGTYT